MNTKIATALIAVVAAASSVAYAGESYTAADQGQSVRSREEVSREYVQARADGQLQSADAYTHAERGHSALSRAEVRLATAKALRAGEINFGEL